ncbi:LPS export ABC transporter permease LptF [Rhodopila sp.]|jgi:lipopolysaccharide export system permease protein|uniref:LPS export ABC transporter permease LptF n=1 Tax=Rhodopila sp. TaxID=2480087 RepID=UPI002B897D30|nr:LPS export ABC transporter permease LptF [Rhodopila sp.]HVZ08582.1 LPS export ABC transporter permease LptF [Rhodopila sp.]
MRSGRLVKRLDIYIFRQVLVALVAATGGLTALIWLTQSLRFVELVVNRGLSFAVFVHLTGLLIPSFVAVILPITTYIVIQFVYQRLSTDRELTVMRAAGLSPWALARPALMVALLTTMLGYALTLYLVPASLAAFRDYQWQIRNRLAAFLLQEGVFTPLSDKLTVYIRSRAPDGTLSGILVDDARDPSAHATILAERGRLVEGPNGPRVVLLDGSRQQIDHQTGRLNMLTFKQNEIDLADATKDTGARLPDMSEVSLPELLDPHPALERDKSKWVAEGYKRLTAPLTTVSYAMVALWSALGGAFRRHGGWVRPLVTVGIMVGLLALGLAIGTLAARDNRLIFLMWLHAILPAIVCGVLLMGPSLVPTPRRLRESAP